MVSMETAENQQVQQPVLFSHNTCMFTQARISPRQLQSAQVGLQDLNKEVLSVLSERCFIELLCGIVDRHSFPTPSVFFLMCAFCLCAPA